MIGKGIGVVGDGLSVEPVVKTDIYVSPMVVGSIGTDVINEGARKEDGELVKA